MSMELSIKLQREFSAFRNRQCTFPLMMSWRPSEQGSLTWQVLLPYAMWLGLLPPATYKDTLLSTQCNYRPSMTRKNIFTGLPGSVHNVQVDRLSSEYVQKLYQPPGWYLEVTLAFLPPSIYSLIRTLCRPGTDTWQK